MSTVVIWPTRKPMYLALHQHYATTNGPSDGPSEGPSEKPGGGLLKYLFYASLTHGIIPNRAAGGTVTTFTRDSVATVTDHEGIIRTCKEGEARFLGARRVENLLSYSEDLTAWIPSNGTIDGNTFYADSAWAKCTAIGMGPVSAGEKFTVSVTLTGNGDMAIQAQDEVTVTTVIITVTDTPTRFTFEHVSSDSGWFTPLILTRNNFSATRWTLLDAQIENVSGQSNQAPSEYVSTDVLTLPFHGANVDGVQYFDTTNGNSVDENNVVIEGEGIELPEMAGLVDSQGPFGYVSETASTNLITYSEEFDNAVWVKTRTSITPNATTAPDGSQGADRVVDTTDVNSHVVNRIYGNPLGITGPVTHSYYLKAGEIRYAQSRLILYLSAGTVIYDVVFDLEAGVITDSNVDGATGTSSAISSAGDGWYRISMTADSDGTRVDGSVYLSDRPNWVSNPTYVGNGTDGFYIWGAQVEQNSISTYIPTQDSVVTRVADVLTYSSEGNIEDEAGTAMAQASTFWSVAQARAVTVGRDIGVIHNAAADPATLVKSEDGTTVATSGTGNTMQGAPQTASATWGADLTASLTDVDGTPVAFDGTIGAGDIGVGVEADGTDQLNGTIREVTISNEETTDDA